MSAIKITKEGSRWIARFPYNFEVKEQVKAAGFRWDPQNRYWWTEDPVVAARLDASIAAQVNQTINSSRAVSADVEIPAPAGLSYLPYQLAGINYARTRDNVLFADEMGLGKTIEAIGVINADESIRTVLVVCTATIKINWSRELTKWLVRPRSIAIANGQFPQADVVIINYDILKKHRAAIDARQWDLLIVDECHKAKNQAAQRTQALYGHTDRRNPDNNRPAIQARKRIFMSGTPIVNRPAELWTLVQALDPNGMGRSFFGFMQRYTDAHHNGYGWDFNGSANLEELQQRLRAKFMVRRLKMDVLRELPAKRRQVVLVPPTNGAISVVRDEMEAFRRHQEAMQRAENAAAAARARGDRDGYAHYIRALHSATRIAFEQMSRMRHATAVAKIPAVIEHLEDVLEGEDKVVVMVHHHDVAHAIKDAFPHAAVITGETKQVDRMTEVDRFQNDPSCKLFIGSIHAAGVGITLTAAQLVVFAELDWVPGNISQAEDRLHRIGQEGSVLVQHLVFDDSVDSIMAQTIIEKQEVIEQALDSRTQDVQAHEIPMPATIAARTQQGNGSVGEIPNDDEIPF